MSTLFHQGLLVTLGSQGRIRWPSRIGPHSCIVMYNETDVIFELRPQVVSDTNEQAITGPWIKDVFPIGTTGSASLLPGHYRAMSLCFDKDAARNVWVCKIPRSLANYSKNARSVSRIRDRRQGL